MLTYYKFLLLPVFALALVISFSTLILTQWRMLVVEKEEKMAVVYVSRLVMFPYFY